MNHTLVFNLFRSLLFIAFLSVSFSSYAQLSVSGTITLSSGFAPTDMNIRVEVSELSVDNVIIEVHIDDVTIEAGNGNVSYQIENITGNRHSVRYACIDNTCGRFVREIYFTPNGQFLEFNGPLSVNGQLPPVVNFTMPVGNTVSGTIIFPRNLPREINSLAAVVQFIPTDELAPNVAIRQFSSPEFITVPVGTREIPFTIMGLPPVQNSRVFPFSSCADCTPEILRFGLPGVLDITTIDPQLQIDNSIPTNQNTTGVQLFHQLGENPSGVIITPLLNLLLEE